MKRAAITLVALAPWAAVGVSAAGGRALPQAMSETAALALVLWAPVVAIAAAIGAAAKVPA
jgi:hypothetical protein